VTQITKLNNWDIPADTFFYILRYNLVPLIERICDDFKAEPRFVGTLLGHKLKFLQGRYKQNLPFDFERIYQLFSFVLEQGIEREIIYKMLPVVYAEPNMEMDSVLKSINFYKCSVSSIISLIPITRGKFRKLKTSRDVGAELNWIMKDLQEKALGNIPLHELAIAIRKGGLG